MPVGISAATPTDNLSLRFVNSASFSVDVELENTSSEKVVLWPFLDVEVLDSEDNEIRRSTNIGRFGFRTAASIIEAIEFVELAPGEVHTIKVNLRRYMYDAKAITGWRIAKAGKYTLRLTYRYDRDQTKKDLGRDCVDLHGVNQPWNKAIEIDQKIEVELNVD